MVVLAHLHVESEQNIIVYSASKDWMLLFPGWIHISCYHQWYAENNDILLPQYAHCNTVNEKTWQDYLLGK